MATNMNDISSQLSDCSSSSWHTKQVAVCRVYSVCTYITRGKTIFSFFVWHIILQNHEVQVLQVGDNCLNNSIGYVAQRRYNGHPALVLHGPHRRTTSTTMRTSTYTGIHSITVPKLDVLLLRCFPPTHAIVPKFCRPMKYEDKHDWLSKSNTLLPEKCTDVPIC